MVRNAIAERTGCAVEDVTQVVGAAAVIFSAAGGPMKRREQLPAALALVRKNAGTSLQRLAAAGRLLLVLLSKDQAPSTYNARGVNASLNKLAAGQSALSEKQSAIIDLLRARLPPIPE